MLHFIWIQSSSHTEQLYLCHEHFLYKSYKEIWDVWCYTWVSFCLLRYCCVWREIWQVTKELIYVPITNYLSFWFKLFHIMPMSYHWFKDKWKTWRLMNCIKLLVQTLLLLVQRDYIKTTLKILRSKITTIVRLVDAYRYYMSSKIWDIVWVSKFKTRSKSMTLLIKK